jgi:hypothetical protein
MKTFTGSVVFVPLQFMPLRPPHSDLAKAKKRDMEFRKVNPDDLVHVETPISFEARFFRGLEATPYR